MSDDELIEKAARALYRSNWGDEFTFEEDREHWIGQARAALAVFREHAAPTGDEREALIEAMIAPTFVDGERRLVGWEPIADAILAAGFRRGAPAEPADRRNRRCQTCGHKFGNHAPDVGCVIEGCPCGQEPAEPAVTARPEPTDELWGRTLADYRDAGWEGDDPDEYDRMFWEAGFKQGVRAALTEGEKP